MPLGTKLRANVNESKGPALRRETLGLLQIALPLAAAYVGELAMFVTTKVVVGRLGYEELAAVGLASSITLELMAVLMGLLSVVAVLVAQAEGGGSKTAAGSATRQGLWLATLVGLGGMALVWNLDVCFALLGQDPVVVEKSGPYLVSLSFSILPLLWFSVLRCFVSALARAGSVMLITALAVLLHLLLTLGLVEGRLMLPALGVFGAGLATSITAWCMLLALFAYTFWTRGLRGYGLFTGKLRPDLLTSFEIIKLGIPVAGLVFLESALFAAVSILSGILGADALAAYEILIAWVGVSFVLALGIAEATMVRVAHGIGRNERRSARTAGVLGMTLGVLAIACLVVVPLAYPHKLIELFLDPADPGFDRVSGIALGLFGIVAVLQVFDGLQATASRALRGLKDTVAPLWIAGFGYWVLGIGGGSLLTFGLGLGAAGLWWGLAAGLIFTGVALSWRFAHLSRTG